jgi:hypothetical protein
MYLGRLGRISLGATKGKLLASAAAIMEELACLSTPDKTSGGGTAERWKVRHMGTMTPGIVRAEILGGGGENE